MARSRKCSEKGSKGNREFPRKKKRSRVGALEGGWRKKLEEGDLSRGGQNPSRLQSSPHTNWSELIEERKIDTLTSRAGNRDPEQLAGLEYEKWSVIEKYKAVMGFLGEGARGGLKGFNKSA